MTRQSLRLDRVLVISAYVLLVGVVVFLSYDVDRRLSIAADVRCANAEIQLDIAALTVTVVESLAALEASDENTKIIGQAVLETTTELSYAALGLDGVCPDTLTDDERAELEDTVELLEEQLAELSPLPVPTPTTDQESGS